MVLYSKVLILHKTASQFQMVIYHSDVLLSLKPVTEISSHRILERPVLAAALQVKLHQQV